MAALYHGLKPVVHLAYLAHVGADVAAQKGKADSEMRCAQRLNEASEQGDAKASLAILQHVHGWTARQEISVDVYQKISALACSSAVMTLIFW